MSGQILHPTRGLGIPLTNAVLSFTEQDEVNLVAASKKGDQDSFALLVQQHQRRVFNLVYRMLQEYEEANEVTQETFLAAWQGLPSFRGDARFSCEQQVDAQLEAHSRQAMVHEQLAKLPAKYRIVLVLRHLHEMTYEEMAEVLTTPIGTIKTHLFRARNLLKERLEMFDREQHSETRGE